jgi:hypothetical protein
MSTEIINNCGCCGSCCLDATQLRFKSFPSFNNQSLAINLSYYTNLTFISCLNNGLNIVNANSPDLIFNVSIFYEISGLVSLSEIGIKYSKYISCYNDYFRTFTLQELGIPEYIDCVNGHDPEKELYVYILQNGNEVFICYIADNGYLVGLPPYLKVYCRYGVYIYLWCLKFNKLIGTARIVPFDSLNLTPQIEFFLDYHSLNNPLQNQLIPTDGFIQARRVRIDAAAGYSLHFEIDPFIFAIYDDYTNEIQSIGDGEIYVIFTFCRDGGLKRTRSSYMAYLIDDSQNIYGFRGQVYIGTNSSIPIDQIYVEIYKGYHFLGGKILNLYSGSDPKYGATWRSDGLSFSKLVRSPSGNTAMYYL